MGLSCTVSYKLATMIRVAIILALLQLVSCHNLPEDWIKCHRSDPNLNKCLKEAVGGAAIHLAQNGEPSLGMKRMDPFDINKIELQQKGRSSSVSLKLAFRNAKLHGISKSSIIKFDAHLDKYALDGETLTPSLLFEADYVMDGKILLLPVTGKGKCNITLTDLKATHDIRGKRTERGGDIYMVLEKYTVSLTPKKLYGYFDNLFNGDKTLGVTVNEFINENWEILFTEMKPLLEKELGNNFLDYSNGIFAKVPFDNIFLP